MNILHNLNVTNKNEILKQDFINLVKSQDLEIFTDKQLLQYIKDIKDDFLQKGEEFESSEELKHLKEYKVLDGNNVNTYYVRSIYDLEKAETCSEEGYPENEEKEWKKKKMIKKDGKWIKKEEEQVEDKEKEIKE